jgi:hypothetical protein
MPDRLVNTEVQTMKYDIKKYFIKTKIPKPNINFKQLWNVEPGDEFNVLPRWKQFFDLESLWDDDTKRKLLKIELYPRIVRVFRWRPNFVFPWHIDGTHDNAVQFAINWVLDGQGLIQWNSSIILNQETTRNMSFGSKLGKMEDPYDCEVYGNQCLVNTSIPHRVINLSNIHRITASMIYSKEITYDDAVYRLKTVNLLEE